VELLSQRAYARRRGCSQAAVWKAIQAGRIPVVKVGSGVKIDPEAADRAWARNTDQSKPSNTETGDPAHRRDPAEPAVPMDLDGIEPFEQIPLSRSRRAGSRSTPAGTGTGTGTGARTRGTSGATLGTEPGGRKPSPGKPSSSSRRRSGASSLSMRSSNGRSRMPGELEIS